MSYSKMMNWHKHHPKGTRQPILMSTGSGFWPSHAWMMEDYLPYVNACKAAGVIPLGCEDYYNKTLRGQIMCGQTMEAQIERAKYYNDHS